MSEQRLKIAVFIDFDNVEIGVKTTLGRQFDVGAVLEAIKERGEIITKVAYGDWKHAGDHSRAMAQHAVRLVQRVMTPGGDKNGADINLALDALEMAFTHDHINAFVIVGGDSDFITLVEKLKQYDRKVFVVGGRAFTSQVMQKNCTEFIAYENIAGPRAPRTERSRSTGTGSSLDEALPLVRRALKVLSDREVSPQLGLLKSTLLQLDSSFSERDYGTSTFRDFAEKLEQRGLVTLKHSGRTTLVELNDERSGEDRSGGLLGPPDRQMSQPDRQASPAVTSAKAEPPAARQATPTDEPAPTNGDHPPVDINEGVAIFRTALSEAATPPRFPMYLRQVKQFMRTARPDFDERRYGSIVDVMRAAQKEGLVRLERDRQGALRVFGTQTAAPAPIAPRVLEDAQPEGIEPVVRGPRRNVHSRRVPLGWTIPHDETVPAEESAAHETGRAHDEATVQSEIAEAATIGDAEAPGDAKPARARRTRKTTTRSRSSATSASAASAKGAAKKPRASKKTVARS